MALSPLVSSENVAGKRGTGGRAGVSVARESHMIAIPQERHEVALCLAEHAPGSSLSKKVTKIIVQESSWSQRQNDSTRCA